MIFTVFDFLYFITESVIAVLISISVNIKLAYKSQSCKVRGVPFKVIYPVGADVTVDCTDGVCVITVNGIIVLLLNKFPRGLTIHNGHDTQRRNVVRVNGVLKEFLTLSDPSTILPKGSSIYIDAEKSTQDGFIHVWRPI